MRVAPFAAEVASSFVVCAALALLDVQAELLRFLPWDIFGVVYDPQLAFLTVLFINLAVLFAPTYEGLSGGAYNNPSVYFVRYAVGDVGAVATIRGAVASTLGHVLAFAALARAVTVYPGYFPGKTPIVPVVPAGTMRQAALAEAAVSASNFIFAGLAPTMFPAAIVPAIGSAFYVGTAIVEGCKYSCGYMNPATVIASHVVAGDFTSPEAVRAMAPYALGSALAVIVVWFVSKFVVGEPKSAKKAKAQGKAAARAVSAARDRAAKVTNVKAKKIAKKKTQKVA